MPVISAYPTAAALAATDQIFISQTNEDASVTTRRVPLASLTSFAAIQNEVTAVVGGITEAAPVTAAICEVTVVPPGGGVILTAAPGETQEVLNRCGTGQVLSVFPIEGMAIENQPTNDAVGIADNDTTRFRNVGTLFRAS